MPASNYAYHVPDPADYFANRHPQNEEEAAFDKLPAAEVRRVVERAMTSVDELQRVDEYHEKTEKTFRQLYPSYLNNEHNAKAMKYHWQNVLGTEVPTLEQMEESFFALRDAGMLQLNQAAVAKEDAARIQQRAEEIKAARKDAEFDEAEAYSMPMAELERRIRGF